MWQNKTHNNTHTHTNQVFLNYYLKANLKQLKFRAHFSIGRLNLNLILTPFKVQIEVCNLFPIHSCKMITNQCGMTWVQSKSIQLSFFLNIFGVPSRTPVWFSLKYAIFQLHVRYMNMISMKVVTFGRVHHQTEGSLQRYAQNSCRKSLYKFK